MVLGVIRNLLKYVEFNCCGSDIDLRLSFMELM